jgi:hypothetical protein
MQITGQLHDPATSPSGIKSTTSTAPFSRGCLDIVLWTLPYRKRFQRINWFLYAICVKHEVKARVMFVGYTEMSPAKANIHCEI